MRRRELLLLLGGAVMGTRALRAQQKAKPVIGYLTAIEPIPALLDEFRSGLAEQGFVEGQNVAIRYRSAKGLYDRLPDLAAELVRDRVDVIVATGGAVSGRAARAATETIPILVLSGVDPAAAGFGASLSRPSENVTGVAQLVAASEPKRLELLHELVPGTSRIAYLENPKLWSTQSTAQNLETAAQILGVKLSLFDASSEPDFVLVFTAIGTERIGALLIGADPFFFLQRDRLVSLAEQNRIPTMYFFREFVTAGGLISYGTSLAGGFRQLGIYAGKILRGAKPADLPIVQQSEKIELVLNLKTAKALDLTIPPAILARADEVIE